MRTKIIGFIFLLLFIILPKNVYAVDQFSTSYDVLYDVDISGVTTVTEKITLRNLTSEFYANEFNLTIGSTKVTDLKASDPGGVVNVFSEQKGTSTSLSLKFNQQVAGIGKTLPWTLSFKTQDFAERIGKVWEIRAPRISSLTNLESYKMTLAVPESFGQPSLISPIPKSQTTSMGKIFLTFDKSQLQSSGISANFGVNQLFDFDLAYHLENKNLFPILTNIALPPDTSFQDVIYQRIDPKPVNVTMDNDGNYLAWYRLNRNQKVDVKVFGSAKLYANSKVKNPTLEETLRKKYTATDKYWEKDNPQIVSQLNEILAPYPLANTEEITKLIFQFVVDHLKYNSSRLKSEISRLGAVTALNNPQSAVCMEFTDLFIALTRAAGIPSRELDGYAYTANTTLRPLSLTKDILHAWPEYWDDRRGWIMVDPTWQNTTGGVDYFSKLDLNHFVFAIKGSSSVSPIPAGSYKYDGQDSRDVKVSLSDQDFLGRPQIDVQFDTPGLIIPGFPSTIKIKITNTGNALFPSATLRINAERLSILNADGINLGPIPPFGEASFDFNIRTKSLLDAYEDRIIISIGEKKFTKVITIKPFILFQTVPLVVVGSASIMILIYLAILGSHIYKKRIKKKAAVKSK